jgi:hypothetical protein
MARRVIRVFESDLAFRVCEAENGLEGLEKAVELRLAYHHGSSDARDEWMDAAEINRAMPTVAIVLFTAYGNFQKVNCCFRRAFLARGQG